MTEYCPDGDLESLIRKKQRISESEAFEYLAQIISSVYYLHSKNIVHRDIKPENILLTGKTLKLIDFGLSNIYNPRGRLKTPCGSPCFAPPEMVCGLEYDPIKSDIWSIGITLYYMVTGTLPFMEKELKTLYQKIVACEITYPPYLSENMITLLSSMLCSNPKTRMSLQSLSEMPLLHSLASSPALPSEINEAVIRTTAKACKIPETLLRGFVNSGHKNGFTAHYYLELHAMDQKKLKLLKEQSDSNKDTGVVLPKEAYVTPHASARKERVSIILPDHKDRETSSKQDKKTFKLIVDTGFDGTMFYSKNTDRSHSSHKHSHPKLMGDKISPRQSHRRKASNEGSAVIGSAIKTIQGIKDSVSDRGSLDVKSKRSRPKDGLLEVVLGRKAGVLSRVSAKKPKKGSPGNSLTNRHHGLTTIPADGLRLKSRSPSQRKNSKEPRPKHKRRVTGEVKPTAKAVLGSKLKSRDKQPATCKTFRPRDGVFAIPKEYFASNGLHTSRSPHSSRPRKPEHHLSPMDRIQNIFIKNSTLVNQLVSPKPHQALPFTNQPPTTLSSQRTKTNSGTQKSASHKSQMHPKTSLFTLMYPDKQAQEYGSPRTQGGPKTRKSQLHLMRQHTSPGNSYAEKSSKQGRSSSKLERSGLRQAGSPSNESEYLMTSNDKRGRRGQKWKLHNKVFEILKNIVKE